MRSERNKASPPSPSFPFTVVYYIVREFFLSFVVSFLFFFVVFFINQILLLAEDILSKNVPFAQTLMLLVYSLPSVVAIAFPFAALAGALMTSARLNADNEILAFSALGISAKILYLPFLVVGLAASLLSFTANDYFLPRGSVAFRKLYGQLVARSASVELTPFSVKRYSKAIVVTGAKDGDKAGDILLFEEENRGADTVISAGRAGISIDSGGAESHIEMEDVTELSVTSGEARKFSVSRADTLSYRFMLRNPIVGFAGSSPSEMSSGDLLASLRKKRAILEAREREVAKQYGEARAGLIAGYGAIAGRGAIGALPNRDVERQEREKDLQKTIATLKQVSASKPSDKSLQIYALEYNKKFAIPAAGFFFAFLAFPLGLGTKRAGRTAGFGLALLLSTLYWAMLFAGQTAGLRTNLSPVVAMWAPNAAVFLAALAVWIFRRSSGRRSV